MKILKVIVVVLACLSGIFNLGAGGYLLSKGSVEYGLPLVLAVLIGYVGFIILMFFKKYFISFILSLAGATTIIAYGMLFRQININFSAKTFYLVHMSALIIPIIMLIIFCITKASEKKKLDREVMGISNN